MIEDMLLPIDKYTRPGWELKEVRGIVIHWYENPGQTAQSARNWFAGLPRLKKYGSAHITLDEHQIIRVVPIDEVAFHVGSHYYTPMARKKFSPAGPNWYLLGIEMAHINWNGEPHPKTEWYTIRLAARWCEEFGLNPHEDLYRHWDITWKRTNKGPCHRWYVEDPMRWLSFKDHVKSAMGNHDYSFV